MLPELRSLYRHTVLICGCPYDSSLSCVLCTLAASAFSLLAVRPPVCAMGNLVRRCLLCIRMRYSKMYHLVDAVLCLRVIFMSSMKTLQKRWPANISATCVMRITCLAVRTLHSEDFRIT